jgi:hypothetical protein
MASASYLQTSFLGGEWAPQSQGAMHDPHYKEALDTCQNYIPLEENSLTRRPGFKFGWQSKAGGVARALRFVDAQNAAYPIEAGGGYFRFGKNRQLLLETTLNAVVSVSSAMPALVTTSGAHGYSTGDYIMFTSLVGAPILRNRQFVLTKISNTSFTLADPVSGSFVGTAVSGFVSANVQRVYQISSPYDSGEIMNVYALQDQNQLVLLHPLVAPTLLTRTAGTDTFATSTPALIDGPYLDPPTDASTLTPDATSGTVTLTASAITSINNGTGFQTTDVGRAVRLFSVPPNWAIGDAHVVGDLTTYQGAYYSCIKANTGKQPDVQYTYWALAPTAATWVWAIIASRTSTTVVVVNTQAFDDGTTPKLLNTNAIVTWQLGVFSNTTGWPSVGGFHEGRLWVASSVSPNRFIGSKTDKHFNFTPTSPDGTIADDNSLNITADSEDANAALWMISSAHGLMIGTASSEWMIMASTLDDPVTPTSIQCRRVTKFGCANVRPAQLPTALGVVHRPSRKIFEYKWFIEPSSGYAANMNAVQMSLRARHLMSTGIAQVEYQADPTPIMWARRNDGLLVGATYRRDPQVFFTAWHQHPLGGNSNNALVQSMAVLPTPDGLSEDLWCVMGRKIPGLIAPDATPNPPPAPTTAIIAPIFVAGGQNYINMDRLQYEESSNTIFVTVQQPLEGIAVYDLNGVLLRSAKIDSDGTGNGWNSGFPQSCLALAPSGNYIIGLQSPSPPSSSLLYVLNRTTLAHVKHAKFGNLYGPQLLCVDGSENYVVGADGDFFYGYHLPSNTVTATLWSTLGISAPIGRVMDAAFDAGGNLWVGEDDGHLEKYSLSLDISNGITPTKLNSYLPHADGKPIGKLTYNNLHNHMLLWYGASGDSGPGRLTRWNISGATVYADFTYPYKQANTGLAGVRSWYAERSNWHDDPVYTDIELNSGNPIVHFFNATSGLAQQQFRSYWPGTNTWGNGTASFMSTNTHTLFAQAGQGMEMLSYDVASFAADDIGIGDGTTHYMEFLTAVFSLEFEAEEAFFVDSGRQDTDDAAAVTITNGVITITGLHYLEAETISVLVNGVDAGDFTVAHGQITFTPPAAAGAAPYALSFGYTYTSLGAMLSPVEGGQNGPAVFKTRRNHKFGCLYDRTQGIEWTEDFRQFAPDKMIPYGSGLGTGSPITAPALFSGRSRDTLQGGGYSFSGKICWRQMRPYPGTLLAVGGFDDPTDV